MQKKIRNHHKLAVEISLAVALMAALMMYLLGLIVMNNTQSMFIESHNEQIRRELADCKNLFMNPEIVGWVLDRWQQNPSVVQPAEEKPADTDEQVDDNQIMEGLLSMNLPEILGVDELNNMSPEMQDAFLRTLYKSIIQNFNQKRMQGKCDRVLCIDVRNNDSLYRDNKDDCYIILDCSSESDSTGSYGLGTYLDPEDTYLDVAKMQYGTYGKDYGDVLFQTLKSTHRNTLLYMAAEPAFVDGVLRYVVCLEYNWSSFARLLNDSLRNMGLWGMLILAGISVLMYLFIYLRAVHPLSRVNSGVLAYMASKDSAAAVESMSQIHEKNEVGILAQNFAAMTQEIERSSAENLRLTSEQKRVETELELATRIQADSLPAVYPDRPEILMHASMDPAKEVGGDFYDFFMIDENRLGLVIADVSGKGVPAALFMMMSKNIIKNYAMMGLSPAEVMSRTNASLCENNPNNMFLTAWFGVLDLTTGHITAANAGHEYPFLRKPGAAFELMKDKHGLALGLMSGMPYREYEFDVEKGGTLFVYTDGVPEATDAQNQLFGTDRMLTALNRNPDIAPEGLLETMKSAIAEFVGDAPQFDDTTMLCVKMK